jgi:hypothetical protein
MPKLRPAMADVRSKGKPSLDRNASSRAHKIFEMTSTLSDLLKTKPFPCRKFSTYLNVINASSSKGCISLVMQRERNTKRAEMVIKTTTEDLVAVTILYFALLKLV